MVLGVLLGLVPIPLPGVGTVTLGIGGGPLIVALIVGRLRRTGPISWVMPLPANIVLRNFGLTLFLATVGINSGQAFVTTVAQTGPVDAADRRGGPADDGRRSSCWSATSCCASRSTTCSASPRAPRAIRRSWSMPPHGADRAARHRLRHDLSLGDHREGRRRADRGARPARLRLRKRADGHFKFNRRSVTCSTRFIPASALDRGRAAERSGDRGAP